jgi:hypothetical protein
MITVAVQCHNFQKRFCWMLSSLAQQTMPNLVEVDVAFLPNNGRPSTEEVVACFQDKLSIRRSFWTDFERFQYRGLVRNQQIQECRTPWLMFGDCDMVYHPDYFQRLCNELAANHQKATYMLSSGRTSNLKEMADKMVNAAVGAAPVFVSDAFMRANDLMKIPKGNVGAGFCQLIHTKHCPHDGYYVKPETNRDTNWSRRGSNPRSDMQFRKRVSKDGNHRRPLPHWFSENAIHLNHDRDPDAGKHLTTQR